MTTNGRRLDRIEEVIGASLPMPSQWEVRAEIKRMEADPEYVSRWSHERVRDWITELEAQLGNGQA